MSEPHSAMRRPAAAGVAIEANAAGVSLSVQASEVLVSAAATLQFCEQAYDVLANNWPLGVRVSGLGESPEAQAQFTRLCTLLGAIASAAHVAGARVEVTIGAGAMAPETAWAIRCRMLGYGALYLLADAAQIQTTQHPYAARPNAAFWLQLWRLRNTGCVCAVYADTVSSSSPLLCAEEADAVQSRYALQVPNGSAWAVVCLDLMAYVQESGAIDEALLEEALRLSVDAADSVHDETRWPTPQMRHDAWLNRRLAIIVTGIGDVVVRRGADPRRFSCLQELSDLLAWIRSTVVARSHKLAQRSELLPALTRSDPTRSLPAAGDLDSWQRLWRRAVDVNGVRHRNLLALSPWSVFPAQRHGDAGFLDLLPLLEFADVCSFADAPPLHHWNINTFRDLHQRARAVLGQRVARQAFAEPV